MNVSMHRELTLPECQTFHPIPIVLTFPSLSDDHVLATSLKSTLKEASKLLPALHLHTPEWTLAVPPFHSAFVKGHPAKDQESIYLSFMGMLILHIHLPATSQIAFYQLILLSLGTHATSSLEKKQNLNNSFNCLQNLLHPVFLSSDNKKSWDDSGVPFFPILSLLFQLPLVCFLHSTGPYYLTESSRLIQVALLPVQINPQQNTWLSFYFLITLNTKNFLPFLLVVLGFVSCLNHYCIIFSHSSAARWKLLSSRPQNLWLEHPKVSLLKCLLHGPET